MKHEKNILIELSEQQKIVIEMILTKASIKALKNFQRTTLPDTVISGIETFADVLKGEIADITFKHMKELADKDAIIERLLKQVK